MPVCMVAYVTLYVMYMYLKVRNTLWQAKPWSHAKAVRPLHVTPLALHPAERRVYGLALAVRASLVCGLTAH
jgi:hypothetical protein